MTRPCFVLAKRPASHPSRGLSFVTPSPPPASQDSQISSAPPSPDAASPPVPLVMADVAAWFDVPNPYTTTTDIEVHLTAQADRWPVRLLTLRASATCEAVSVALAMPLYTADALSRATTPAAVGPSGQLVPASHAHPDLALAALLALASFATVRLHPSDMDVYRPIREAVGFCALEPLADLIRRTAPGNYRLTANIDAGGPAVISRRTPRRPSAFPAIA